MKKNKPKILLFDIEPYYQLYYRDDGKCKIVSNNGNRKELSQYINKYGYLSTKLNGKTTTIHGLIASLFLGKRPIEYSVNHKDCNKLNNRIDNLEYITIAENVKHAIAHGLHVCSDPKRSGRYKDGRAIKSRIKEYKREWYLKNKKEKS